MRIGRLHFGLKFAWYDLWIGLFWDRKKRRLYFGIPMFVLWFEVSRPLRDRWSLEAEADLKRQLVDKKSGLPIDEDIRQRLGMGHTADSLHYAAGINPAFYGRGVIRGKSDNEDQQYMGTGDPSEA